MQRLAFAVPVLFAGCLMVPSVTNQTNGGLLGTTAGGSTGSSTGASSTGTAAASSSAAGSSAGSSTGSSTGGQTSSGSTSGGTSTGAASSTGAPPPLFMAPVRYMVGTSPHNLTTLFLAADGGEDLAASNSGSGDVSILLNKGDGTFTTDTFGPFGVSSDGIGAICSAYFTHHDSDDVAVISTDDGNIAAVLLGNSSGKLGTPGFIPSPVASPAPLDLISGDWNGDGNPDIALVDSNSNELLVSFGFGDGGFGQFFPYPAEARTYALTAADLDGMDGPDIVVANNSADSISVFLNDGGGIFNLGGIFSLTTPAYADEPQPVSIAAGDFDGKNGLDLAVVDNSNGAMCIFLNDGKAGFVEQAVTYPLGKQPQNAVTADFDGDGNLDLAVPIYSTSMVAILLGNGDGTFQPAQYFSAGVNTEPIWIVVGDFNQDGKWDLATANFLTNDVSVFLNNH